MLVGALQIHVRGQAHPAGLQHGRLTHPESNQTSRISVSFLKSSPALRAPGPRRQQLRGRVGEPDVRALLPQRRNDRSGLPGQRTVPQPWQ